MHAPSFRADLHDLHAGGDAAREREFVAAVVRGEERARLALALDHVVHAVRHATLLQDLGGDNNEFSSSCCRFFACPACIMYTLMCSW